MSAQLDSDSTLHYRRISEADLEYILAIESLAHSHPWTRGNLVD